MPFPPVNPPEGCANQSDLREAQGSTYLPDCRAYEMVSPVDKNQGGLESTARLHDRLSRDGEAAAFSRPDPLRRARRPAGPPVAAPYLSRRGPEGWQTADPFPPLLPAPTSTGEIGGSTRLRFLSPTSSAP